MSTSVKHAPVQGDATHKAHAENSRIFPTASHSEAAVHVNNSNEKTTDGNANVSTEDEYQMRQISADHDEGVEVVLDGTGNKTTVVDHPLPPTSRPSQDQNVFRAPHPVRPRAVRGGRPPHVHASGSYGYGPPPHYGAHHGHALPPPHGGYRQQHAGPYPVPYAPSGSFDHQDGGSAYPGPPTTSHYSPHVQYPPPASRRAEDVNVISPNHKDHHPHHPHAPRSVASGSRYPPSGSGYQYPPQSPVSRPGGPAVAAASPPRTRGYARHPGYPTPERSRPPLVTESSFDSDYYSSHASHSSSHPTTPNATHYGGGPLPPHANGGHHDPHYGYGGSFEGSFDSHHPPHGGHHQGHYDERSHYHSPPHPYSDHSPYSSHSYGYSPGGGSYYDPYSPFASHYARHPRSYDEHERYHHYYGHPEYEHGVKKDDKSGMILPKAAAEIDFDITDPPLEPTTPASSKPVCETPADVNSYDVLCGRGGGTNSQIGNRRFRKLVQEFQPIYLLARRKEKPLLARTIVLIIRKRGGRFLKKDEETGELYEVGDAKAEAKTSQALREGLDVRATKSAASSLMDKKKKQSLKPEDTSEKSPQSPVSVGENITSPSSVGIKSHSHETEDTGNPVGSTKKNCSLSKDRTDSPPTLPKLHGEHGSESSKAEEAPPSPEQMQFRKRRRMRSSDGDVSTSGCGVNPFSGDKLFPDFCPPRADLARTSSPPPRGSEDDAMDVGITPIAASSKYDDDDIRYDQDTPGASNSGCAGIALDMMTGAAAGSFCLGPRQWR
jgi:hypothetical protein